MRARGNKSPWAALVFATGLAACGGEAERDPVRHEPMRAPASQPAAPTAGAASAAASELASATQPSAPSEPARAEGSDTADEIEQALELISTSGHTFIDQADAPDERPSEYTAEQFASMLRTKWEWLGYDLQQLQPWLDEIATRSFKSNLPYLVTLENGTTSELRAWLDAELAAHSDGP